MARQVRQKSSSGIYHIMLRGIDKQIIFNDDYDKEKFIETLEKYKTISEYRIFAYCLMTNHIHLLIKVEKEDLDLIIKRIAGSYVYWYNCKYKRTGHLFQDRYKSEPVENDEYFLTVIRYIHQNPIKSGFCKKLENYKYSSYNEYINEPIIIDRDFCLGIIGIEEFEEFHNQSNEDVCLDIKEKVFRMTDDEAMEIIRKVSHCKTVSDFQSLSIDKRNKYLKILREKGISIRQLSRLTGISYNIVRKY